jgi:hypothetical protein
MILYLRIVVRPNSFLLAEMVDNYKRIYNTMETFCDSIDEFIMELETLLTQRTSSTSKQALNDATFTLSTNRKRD